MSREAVSIVIIVIIGAVIIIIGGYVCGGLNFTRKGMDGCAHGRRKEAGPAKDGRRGPQASPQQKHPSKHTPMKHTYEDLPPPPP